MTDKLSAELRRRMVAAVMEREAARRKLVAETAEQMSGLTDAEAAEYFQQMLDDAEPGMARAVSNFVAAVKAARAATRKRCQ